MKKTKTSKTKYIVIGVCCAIVAIIAIIIALSISRNESIQTPSNQAEAMRLDAIAQQIRIKAESYHDTHGVWPESLEDIHESTDRLPNLVFNSFKNSGFIMSYIGADGERVVYCSEDFAETPTGQKNCP